MQLPRSGRTLRFADAPAVIDAFLTQGLEVAAGIRQQLQGFAQRIPGLRLLPGRFMLIQQAMGLAKSRGPEAATYLSAFVEAKKSEGFLAQALARHRIEGAEVAPVASV